MATRYALSTFTRTFADPYAYGRREAYQNRQAEYVHLWAMYENSKFEDLAAWEAYRAAYRLYRYVRSLYNPTRRLVDFYAAQVYPGTLAVEPDLLPDGEENAMPLPPNLDPRLADALGQIWQWSNWQSNKTLLVRFGACLGNVAVEIVDDLESRKVRTEIIWPGMITDLIVDAVGDVKSYTIEYEGTDPDGTVYEYKREVDQETIRTYRDREPYGYDDLPAAYDNPYGFAPMVWIPHTNMGSERGAPAMRHINKFDEVNSFLSQLLDYAKRHMAAPLLLAGGKRLPDVPDPESTINFEPIAGGQQIFDIILAPSDAHIDSVAPQNIPDMLAQYDRLIKEIEEDHPELTMYRELRQMSQITGPAASRLLGDVAGYVRDAQSNYDGHSIKLFQMAIAIAGMRANRGDWGAALDRQRSTFTPFGLDSYAAGDLDFIILPRPLIPELASERLQRRRLRAQFESETATTADIEARIAEIADVLPT